MYLFLSFPAQWTSIGRGNRRWKAALQSLFARITVLVVEINQGAWNKGKQLMKVSDLPSTGTTHSIRLILAIFYWQANTFTQLCQNNTKRALLLWGLKQVLGSNMTGLRSKFDFKWTTTQTTVVSHRRRKRFSSSATFLFWSELITQVFGKKSIVFLHFPRKFRVGRLGLLSLNFNFRNVIFQPMVFPFVWVKYNENWQGMVASSPFAGPSRILAWLASLA